MRIDSFVPQSFHCEEFRIRSSKKMDAKKTLAFVRNPFSASTQPNDKTVVEVGAVVVVDTVVVVLLLVVVVATAVSKQFYPCH